MTIRELHGVIVPVITPTDDREDVDEPAFRSLIRRLIAAGVHGIFVGGSTGEGPLLDRGPWQRMAEIAFDEVRGDVPLLAGVMDTSSRKACEKIEVLRNIGYRWFVLTPAFYIATKTATEHLRLFERAKEAAGNMEMIAYNIPQCTGSALAVETVCGMARRGWIRYCKDSSGDIDYFQELVRCGKDVGLKVFEGDELTMADALRVGACGIVPVCANIFPQIYIRAYEAAVRGDWTAVAQAHEENLRVRTPMVAGGACWLSGIKYAASRLGIGLGRPVSPLEPAGSEQMAQIDSVLKAHGESSLC